MKSILVSPSSFGECGLRPLELMKENGYQPVMNPYGRKLKTDELLQLASNISGVIAGLEVYDKTVIDMLPSLKVISRVGVGVDAIDLDHAKSRGIDVLITPEGPTQAVAELSVALAFDLSRSVSKSDRRIRNGVWKKEIGFLLSGKTVGVLGLGRIGRRAATLYASLGCKVIANDVNPDRAWMVNNGVQSVTFTELLKDSDIITIHVPGSDGRPLLGTDELRLTKPHVMLINLARGGVIDETSLLDHLRAVPSSSAALDVFEMEPYSGDFTQLDNVVLTPHLGSYAKEAKLRMEVDAVTNLIEALKEKNH
jgi:D-3-phosphoglycerate dehydrogenase